MFDFYVMYRYIQEQISRKVKQFKCPHSNAVTTRNDGDTHVEFCPDCEKRILIRKIWTGWK